MDSVSKRQVVILGIALVLEANLVSLPNQIIGAARMDAWLSYLIGMGCILVPLWLASKVLASHPGQDLFAILVGRHPMLGRAAAVVVLLFIFILLVRDIRVLTEFVSIALLPATPLVMISLLIVISIVLTTRGGIQVIARMMEIWVPLFILFLLFLAVLLYTEFEPRNLLPLFNRGLGPPFAGSWYAVAYIGEIMLLPFLFGAGPLRFREGLLGLAIGTGLLLLVNFYLLLTLGANLSGKILFPLYEIVRIVRVTDFLDRFDLPYILIYLPMMITKVGLLLYALCHGLKRVLPALSIREFMLPLGVWCFVSSFWFFQNSVQLYSMNRSWPVFALLCEVALPVLFFLLLYRRKKENRAA
ncbi:GerAB/ArcD/ProY family transporter [Gorillibacterium sp. sgz5001074]|uniref:GerAB/ArcD/ProY family transporter n=1 Tax=Gorillibacterium sp. sgz5001074 TaxID=3446695 RepID=UPI003F6703DF